MQVICRVIVRFGARVSGRVSAMVRVGVRVRVKAGFTHLIFAFRCEMSWNRRHGLCRRRDCAFPWTRKPLF